MTGMAGEWPTYGVALFAVAAALSAVCVDRMVSRRGRVAELGESVAVVKGRSPAGMVASAIATGTDHLRMLDACPEASVAMAARPGSRQAVEDAVFALARSGDSCVAIALSPMALEGDAVAAVFGRRGFALVVRGAEGVLLVPRAEASGRLTHRGSLIVRLEGGTYVLPFPVWAGTDEPLAAVGRLALLEKSESDTALRLRGVKSSFA